MKSPNNVKKQLIISLVVGVIIVATVLAVDLVKHQMTPPTVTTPVPAHEIVLEGKIACLPAKGTGPHIDICSIGLQTSTNSYYGLDMNGHDPQYKYSQTGLRVRVTGRLTSATTSTFESAGTIMVPDIQSVSTPQ
jgi:hypothetical protein